MAWLKILALSYKAQRGWKRIPPEQRRKMVESAIRQARKHGPVVAKRLGDTAQRVRKSR